MTTVVSTSVASKTTTGRVGCVVGTSLEQHFENRKFLRTNKGKHAGSVTGYAQTHDQLLFDHDFHMFLVSESSGSPPLKIHVFAFLSP